MRGINCGLECARHLELTVARGVAVGMQALVAHARLGQQLAGSLHAAHADAFGQPGLGAEELARVRLEAAVAQRLEQAEEARLAQLNQA